LSGLRNFRSGLEVLERFLPGWSSFYNRLEVLEALLPGLRLERISLRWSLIDKSLRLEIVHFLETTQTT